MAKAAASIAPWARSDPAESQRQVGDAAVGDIDARSDRHQSKAIGRTVAHLSVRLPALCRGRQHDGSDHIARLQDGFDVRRVAGQSVQVVQRHHPACVENTRDLDFDSQRHHRDGHVAGMGRDALLACPKDGVQPGGAPDRAAAGCRFALIAGRVSVVEVVAARALPQVARRRRLVAQLPAGPRQERFGQHRIRPA